MINVVLRALDGQTVTFRFDTICLDESLELERGKREYGCFLFGWRGLLVLLVEVTVVVVVDIGEATLRGPGNETF